jgi:hypothetical protein
MFMWCLDFVLDHTTSGTSFKWLSIMDEYTQCRHTDVVEVVLLC